MRRLTILGFGTMSSNGNHRFRGPRVARFLRLLAILTTTVAVFACGGEGSSESSSPDHPAPGTTKAAENADRGSLDAKAISPASSDRVRPPVVLISVDTLRSDRLPVYGHTEVDTPNIDRFRQDAILVEHVFSPYPLTLPAHASILTGLQPPEHGVRDNSGYRLDTTDHVYLPTVLRESGYATGAAVSTYVLRATTGLSEGFDFYEDGIKFRSQAILGEVQRPGLATLEAARPWLESVVDQPFFFLFHIYELHTPHNPPEPFASRYSSPYDGEVALADAIVGKLMEELERLGVYDRALIVLTSDHGEGLNDHDDYAHGLQLYREAIQVPLIVKLPGGRRAGETVSQPGQLIDIAPSILDLIDIEPPATLPGRALFDADGAGDEVRASIYAETYFPTLHFGWSHLRSLIDYPYHYIEGPDPELYNLDLDPQEKTNILRDDRRIFGRLRQELEEYDAGFVGPSEVDPETQEQLEALGYLGGVGGEIEGPLPDPKSQLHVLEGLKSAVDDFSEGRYLEAIVGFRAVLAEQPRLIDAWEHLGQSLMAIGRIEEAYAAFETGFEVSGGSPHFATELAGALLRMNRLDEARKFAEIAADAHELSHDLLAQIAIRQGDLEAAKAYVDRAVATRGTRIAPLITRAELNFSLNKLEEVVRQTFEIEELAAKDGELQQLRGLFLLRGSAYVRLGQGEKAITAFQREIELFPTDLAAYSRLAILYNLLGRTVDARSTVQQLVATNPIPPAYAEGVTAYRSISMENEANGLLREGLQRWPDNPHLQRLRDSS